LHDNGDFGDTDQLSVFDTSDNLIGSTSSLPISIDSAAFFGFTSDVAIGRIHFDEDVGGDDIAIANFRFGLTAVPEPGTAGILGIAGLCVLIRRRRRRSV